VPFRILLCSLWLLVALALAACGGSPALELRPGSYDFGPIDAGAAVTTVLQVSNTGKGDLTIRYVTTSCGCTTAHLDRTTLQSGAVANLTITFDPQAHPGLYGPLLRVVYLHSNDPARPEVEIPVHVEILEPSEES
jgi:hypothetical protein